MMLFFCNSLSLFPLLYQIKQKQYKGPPKTATTHIQCGLEKYSLRLAKEDKYHFLGGGCGVPEQGMYCTVQ